MTNAGSLMMGAHKVFLPWGPKGSQSAPEDCRVLKTPAASKDTLGLMFDSCFIQYHKRVSLHCCVDPGFCGALACVKVMLHSLIH